MSGLGEKIIRGTVWSSIDKIGTMAMHFVVNLVLTRILFPADFGCIGMLTIFISVSQTLVDGGFGSALIQKKEPTQKDYSTIFYWNLFFSVVLYGLLYLTAPFIAAFFKMRLLCKVLRALGLILIINALIIVQNNRLRKQLAFKKIALINICSYFLAAIIAIWLAYKNYGIWSLVAMQLLYGIFQCLMLWGIVHWYPSLQFSFVSLRKLFGFGGYLLASNIFAQICKNMQGLIIGRKFSATQMGFYTQAKKLDDICSYALPNVLTQVLYPVYSKFQNDRLKLHELLGISIRIISYFIFPLMIVMILVAKPLILFLYGEKWVFSIPYFQVLCVGGIFACLQHINYYAIAAIGKSNELFKWSIYKWGMLLIMLFLGSHFGMYGILWGMVISDINIFTTNIFLVNKFVGYSLLQQISDFIPILIISIISFVTTYLMKVLMPNLHFVFVILLFICIYIILSFIFRLRVMNDIARIKTSFLK